jgi:hypothetical protein
MIQIPTFVILLINLKKINSYLHLAAATHFQGRHLLVDYPSFETFPEA